MNCARVKALISLVIFLGIVPVLADPAEDTVEPETFVMEEDFEITNVMTTYFLYDTLEQVHDAWNELHETEEVFDPEFYLEGFSDCEFYIERNFAHCDVYVMRPTVVDGENTLTVGHENFHGVYGPNYHKTVW